LFFFLFKADYRGVLEQSAGLCFFFKSGDQHADLEHYCRRDILKCSGAIRGNICPACELAILPESSISPIPMLSSVLLTVLLEVVRLLLLLLDVVFAAE
jgi:hypothetical protein